ncbi:MAG: 50S ribosomal protein L30e [Candidatus Micrarchaeota archaeon]|nr:50S ribosomal protein L30e [Candidatus Micrarchaeota archaeon]
MAKKTSNNAVDSASLSKAIRMCLDSGKVELGARTAIREALLGHGKLIVLASNAPADEQADLARYCALSNLPLLKFEGTSLELGSVCGKPFPVSALWVSEVGNSPIMGLVSKA